jgi:HlyD family secretion protein
VKQVRLGSQNVQNVVIYTTIISIENPRRELLPGMTANLRVETERRENALRIPNAALRWRPQADTAPASPQAGGAPASPPRGGNSAEFIAAIKAELKPTAEQMHEIDAGMAELRQVFMASAADDANARRERFRLARRDLEQRIAAVLTPEQKPVFEEIVSRFSEQAGRTSQSGRVFVVGRDGKPQGVTIRIGATDGGYTEVVAGLDAGAEVIVGGGGRGTATPRGPRFGF